MDNNHLVDYSIAKKLKRLGFREICLYHYDTGVIMPNQVKQEGYEFLTTTDCEGVINYRFSESNRCDAPTYGQAQNWIYQTYDILPTFRVSSDYDGHVVFLPQLYVFESKGEGNYEAEELPIKDKKGFKNPNDALGEAICLAFKNISNKKYEMPATPYTLRRDFLKVADPNKYYESMGYSEDTKKTTRDNRLDFLAWVNKNELWTELYSHMKGNVD